MGKGKGKDKNKNQNKNQNQEVNKQLEEVIEEDIVTLTLDGDVTVNCSVIGIFEAANGMEYIALLPNEGEDADTGEVYLYRYSETEDEEPVLENIIDDDEFELASDAFDEMLDSMEFDELVEE